jgi:dihydropyrimidinase
MRTLVTGGTLASDSFLRRGDVLVEDEHILEAGSDVGAAPTDRRIDARGCFVMPGLVDPHVHFQLISGPFATAEDFAAGSRAALCGGVTTVVDYTTHARGQSLLEALEKRQGEAEGRIHVDYGLHAVVVDLDNGQLEELPDLPQRGVPSLKIFTTYRRAGMCADDLMILTLMKRAREEGLLVTVHAENDAIVEGTRAALVRAGATGPENHGRSRPAIAEAEAVNRAIFLATNADCPLYVVHVSTPQGVRQTAAARRAGRPVITESCPQYLLLDDSAFAGPRPKEFICCPPIRSRESAAQMRQLLTEGAILTIGTDHCGYTREQKSAGTTMMDVPPGLPGVETTLPLLYSRLVVDAQLPLERLVRLVSANPARVFGFYPRKGSLQPGTDADLVIYDPRGESVLGDDGLHGPPGSYTPYAGQRIHGRVRATMLRGRLLYHEGELLADTAGGRFVPGRPFDRTVIDDL